MTFRARIAWSLGAVGGVIVGVTYLVHAVLSPEAALVLAEGAPEQAFLMADRILLGGALVSLGVLAGAGVIVWRSMGGDSATKRVERIAADRAVHEREQVMSSINANLEGTCVYRMVYHRDGRMECTYVSPNVESLIGLPASRFLSDAAAVFSLVHPDDLPGFRQAVAQALATGAPASIPVRLRHPNGGELWMQFRSHLCERRADGAQVRDGVVSDITAIKSAESEIRAVRQRLELALSASRTSIWENYVTANRIMLDATWAEIRGLPPAPRVATGQALLAIAHPDDRAAMMAATRRTYHGETDEYRVEQRVARADGSWAWILSVGRVTARDENGRAVRAFGTNTDITARRQAEEQVRDLNANLERLVVERTAELVAATDKLATSERIYRNLIDNLNQGFYVSDRRSLFSYCNPAVAAVAGKTEWELLGTSVFRLVAAEDRKRVITAYRQWEREGVLEATIEFRTPTHSGRIIWVEQSTVIVRAANGGVVEYRNSIRDITERKAAEALLLQSNERFRAVFDRSPIMIGLLTVPEGRLVEFNASGVSTFGYTREEALGRTTVELGLWADPDERARYVAELIAKGQVSSFEAKMRRKNGEIFYVAYTGSIIEIGGQRYSLNSLLDITAQRDSEARLSHALEATNDGVWDWSVKTGAFYFSPQWARLLDYLPGEVPARVEFYFSILHPDDVAIVQHALAEHMAGRLPVKQNEVRLRTKSGEYRWFLDRGKVVVRDSSGAPERMVGTITDITERKRVEESNARTLASLRATLESTADGIMTIGADRRIESMNSVFVTMWRVPAEILASRDDDAALQYAMSQLAAPQRFFETMRYLYDHPMEESFDTLDFKDGRLFERFSRPMVSASGQPVGRVWSFRDITERRRAEEEREQMQGRLRATQKMEAMGTLAGGIAHDFNNILTGVINYSMLAREECPPGHPRFVKYLEAVLACGHRAKDLVRQILLFSRAEESRQESVQVGEIVEEALALLRSTLPATVSIEFTVEPNVPRIIGSPTQLHQVVMNLGINAAQALPKQSGLISVRLQAVDVDAAIVRNLPDLRPGPHVRLEVTDTGCGIDGAVLPRIFDPFFTTKPAGQGTGLGLSVVHGIVGGHHGAIAVRSQPDAGATFQVYFPAQTAKAAPVTPLLTQQPRGKGEQLLLVEDEPIVLETLKLILEGLGYHVTEFSSPNEALTRFTAGADDFDLLLTDYMMPGMTGIQLAEKIVTIRPSLPVLITSGFFGDHTPEELQRLNVKAVVPKPIEMNELALALARAFGR